MRNSIYGQAALGTMLNGTWSPGVPASQSFYLSAPSEGAADPDAQALMM